MDINQRKQNRLKFYDYSSEGCYFVTICTMNRNEIFWKPVRANSVRPQNYTLSSYGKIAEKYIKSMHEAYDNISVDNYVIMPNHIHFIIRICDKNGRTLFAPTLSRIIKQFKGIVPKEIGHTIWQKSFHDHVIRNEDEYNEICEYISYNPDEWENDCFFKTDNTN